MLSDLPGFLRQRLILTQLRPRHWLISFADLSRRVSDQVLAVELSNDLNICEHAWLVLEVPERGVIDTLALTSLNWRQRSSPP
jgi:hypothetical protein